MPYVRYIAIRELTLGLLLIAAFLLCGLAGNTQSNKEYKIEVLVTPVMEYSQADTAKALKGSAEKRVILGIGDFRIHCDSALIKGTEQGRSYGNEVSYNKKPIGEGDSLDYRADGILELNGNVTMKYNGEEKKVQYLLVDLNEQQIRFYISNEEHIIELEN